MAAVVTVNDVLDGHVGLDVECLDRIYLNGYVPNLQVSGQVASFMTAHLGYGTPHRRSWRNWTASAGRWTGSPPTTRSRWCGSVRMTARSIGCGRIWRGKWATGRAGVAAIGVAQELASVFTVGATRRADRRCRCGSRFTKADRRVTCYYF